jgi:splicing factor U2AF subunit
LLTLLSGTEQDRVNCSFYLKIGACRHGDRCSRKHIHPQYSQTILLPNVYNNPIHTPEGQNMSAEELQANFDRFYEDFFIELAKCGHLLEMHVSTVHAQFVLLGPFLACCYPTNSRSSPLLSSFALR